jgi:hypothetical protein
MAAVLAAEARSLRGMAAGREALLAGAGRAAGLAGLLRAGGLAAPDLEALLAVAADGLRAAVAAAAGI